MAERQHGSAGRLVAVVVSYNRLNMLKITIKRLLETPSKYLQAVVIIDNASDDGTEDWLSGHNDPRLCIHRLPANSGGSGGFEAGMRLARQRFDPDWLVVMDDDGRPETGALEAFHRMDLSRWDAVAAAVYFPDGRICEMNRPSRNPFWHGWSFLRTALRGRDGFHLPPESYDGQAVEPIDVTSFVGFFISRHGLDLAGYPDPGLFLYGDDGIYTLALTMAGGRICFDPNVRFEHDCQTFSTAQRGRFSPLWKVYYYHRNLLMLYRMAAGWMFWPVLIVIVPKWFIKTLHHTGERRRFLALMVRAIHDGLLQRTGVDHSSVQDWALRE